MRRTAALATMAVVAALSGIGLAGAPPVSAQTPYPPGPCRPLSGTQFAGTISVGQTIVVPLNPVCVWVAGSPVAVSVNGVPVGNKIATAAGSVSVTITAVSATTLSVDDPVLVPAVCGVNTVTGTGFSAVADANVTQTSTFNLTCDAGKAPVVKVDGPTQSVSLPARVTKGALAFTGANIWPIAALALLLLAAGSTLAIVGRKKAGSRT